MSSTISGDGSSKASINIALSLAALVLIALAMAIPTLKMGLWLDECGSVYCASMPDLQTVITTMYGRMNDLHPPLYYVVLYTVMHFFGINEVIVRLPSVAFGLMLIPATYWLGKTAHSRTVGLLSAFFAALSPFANYFSCQTRGYALAALLTALCLTFFCQLLDDRYARKTWPFVGATLTAAMLCYTEYVCCFMMPGIGLAVVLVCLRLNANEATKHLVLPTFKRGVGALFLAALLFAPWVPSLLTQSHFGTYMEKPSLSQWPLVFSFNLLMMLPVPLIVGIPLTKFALAATVVVLFLNRKNLAGQPPLAKIKDWLFAVPSSYILLLGALLFPSSIIGYVTLWWIGYFRYMYPYSAIGWVLLATLLVLVFNSFKAGRSVSNRFTWIKPRGVAVGLIVAMFALNALYLTWFTSRSQSGLRVMAREALNGKYDNCAILLTPDSDGPSLEFYLPENEREKHHIVLCGFPRWSDIKAPVMIPQLQQLWNAPELVPNAEKQIEELARSGRTLLAFTKDPQQIEPMSCKEVPRATRIKSLEDALDAKYKTLSVQHYNGLTEDVIVKMYQLTP